MQLSIIIINYNTFSLTCKCIESILEFTLNVDFEIILVDNASVECNPQIFLEKFPNIQLIKSNVNGGFAKGNNLGLEIAKGEYILLLNSDTELIENSIEISLNKIINNPKIGVLSCQLVYPNGGLQYCANSFPSISYEIVESLRLQKLMTKKQQENFFLGGWFDHLNEREVGWVWGAFFLTKLEVINKFKHKKFPDDFFMYVEDTQWCYKIKQFGYKIFYTADTKIIHHLRASGITYNDILKNMNKTLPNEATFLLQEKGKIYTYILYILRTIKYFSLRKPEFTRIARFYARFVWNGLKTD